MREIALKITADNSQAKAALSETEQALDRVGQSASKAGSFIDQATKQASPAMANLHKDTLQFSQGLKGNEEQLLKLSNTTKRETSAMDSSLAALGRRVLAVFAVERIISFGQSVIDAGGHIKDLSDKTGLSTQAIQKFGYAAGLTGSSIDGVANAISVMSKGLVGGGGAVDALRKLGLSQQDLLAMQPERAFVEIAEAIRKVKNPMEQASLAMAIFGKAGKELLPMIRDGVEEVGDAAPIMRDETVRALDDLGDAFKTASDAAAAWAGNTLGDLLRVARGLAEMGKLSPNPKLNTPEWQKAQQQIFGDGRTWLEKLGNWFDFKTDNVFLPETTTSTSDTAMDTAAIDRLLKLTTDFDKANRDLGETHSRVTQAKRVDAKATDDLTTATLKYLQAQKAQIVGLGSLVPMLERVAAYRGLLSEAGVPYLQTGIAGATQPDPYAGLNVGTHPYSMVGLQGAVTGTPGLAAGATPYNTPGGTGFWNSRGGQAAGIGIGVAGSAAMGAMTGGDPYAAMIGSTASAVGGAMLAGTISSTVALGAATMGIGAAAVGVYLLVKHFASVSKEVKQARLEVDAFQENLWKTMTAQQVTEASGEKWAATTIVVRDAYERMGYSAAQAESEVAKLLDTRRPDEARAAMARINEVMSTYQAILAGVNEHMGELLTQSATLGQRLPQALLDSLAAAVQLGDMTEENARLIAQLTQAGEVDWDKFEEAAKRYGIAVDSLGQQFQQAQLSKTAQQMIDDMEILLKGGASMGTILFGMKEEISDVVQKAMKFGTELPANMKPWIEELMKAGLLVDAQGEALTDITKLKFGETMQSTFQRVADSIQELVDLLKGPLTNALDTVGGKVVKPKVQIDVEGPAGDGGSIWDGTRNGFAHGGVVYAANGWVPRGTDTVPAMLTPGEGVLSRRGMAMLGALNSGRTGGGDVHVHVDLTGATLLEDASTTARRLTEMVSRQLVRDLSRERKFAAVIQ